MRNTCSCIFFFFINEWCDYQSVSAIPIINVSAKETHELMRMGSPIMRSRVETTCPEMVQWLTLTNLITYLLTQQWTSLLTKTRKPSDQVLVVVVIRFHVSKLPQSLTDFVKIYNSLNEYHNIISKKEYLVFTSILELPPNWTLSSITRQLLNFYLIGQFGTLH